MPDSMLNILKAKLYKDILPSVWRKQAKIDTQIINGRTQTGYSKHKKRIIRCLNTIFGFYLINRKRSRNIHNRDSALQEQSYYETQSCILARVMLYSLYIIYNTITQLCLISPQALWETKQKKAKLYYFKF